MTPNSALPAGTWLVSAGRVSRIARAGNIRGADGYWVQDFTGDPGSGVGLPVFTPARCAKPAVVGQTVCPRPRGDGCGCPLAHVTAAMLAALRTQDRP